MDLTVSSWVSIIGTLGVPSALAFYLLFKVNHTLEEFRKAVTDNTIATRELAAKLEGHIKTGN